MARAIVNGIVRTIPALNHSKTDIQFAFKSRNQLPWFMIWKVWYDCYGEVEFAKVLFKIG